MELFHHGIPNMKWGEKNGPPYPLSKAKHNKVVRSRTPKAIKAKKGTKFYRYSNKEESKDVRKGTYSFRSENDAREYLVDSKNVKLGFKDYDKLYITEIEATAPLAIKRGKEAVKDIVDKYGTKTLQNHFDILDKSGFYDDSLSAFERGKIWESVSKSRNKIGNFLNEVLYKSPEKKEEIYKMFKEQGYDAFVDPEDFTWNYETPTILLNESKFKKNKTGVVFNKSMEEFDKEYDKWVEENKNDKDYDKYWDFLLTKEDTEYLTEFMNKVIRHK
jgi:hypothetical protein